MDAERDAPHPKGNIMLATMPRIVLLGLVFWFAGIPLIFLLYGSVHSEQGGDFTLAYLEKVFVSGEHYQALRSEEHTSELQSLMRIAYAVFCLKKKKNKKRRHIDSTYRSH